jgi:sterol desaturase/sphingolipid hydroxylase (fatty acid hydroxylase superfamily)
MRLVEAIMNELEADPTQRRIGQGWVSGVVALTLALLSLGTVLVLRYPQWLSVPEIRGTVDMGLVRMALQSVLLIGFLFAMVSLILRQRRVLGFSAAAIILLAMAMGGAHAHGQSDLSSDYYLGLDWFMLNLLMTGMLFLPLERLFARREQAVFRDEWREDLFYFFISSLMVQGLSYFAMAPSKAIVPYVQDASFRATVAALPLWVQVIAIMFLTDLVQYWVHRVFHRVPWLWRFHAVHHSARTLDWLAGSRMHLAEIIVLRGLTVIPMYAAGFAVEAIYIYLVIVYLYATYIHANLKWNIEWIKPLLVTPRFHHWHHGIEKEAIDVNFAIHFPWFDRLFGTYHMPEKRWPEGYGVAGHPVPSGYLPQMAYPFRRK